MGNFTKGQTLSRRSIGDHNCIFTATVLKVTEKSVTIKNERGEKRCKIHEYEGEQFIYPYGQYSMAPTFRPEGQHS